MKTQFCFLSKCVCFILLLGLLLLSAVRPTVYAAPTENPPSSETETTEISKKWVDLKAHVPEDFNGSVSVLLQHDETGDLYTVTSYLINDYVNSIYLPVGKYTVMQAYTSEDSFLYDTFIKTETFDLQNSLELEVTVQKNATGAAYLEQLKTQPTEPVKQLTELEDSVVSSAPEHASEAKQEQESLADETNPSEVTEEESASVSVESSEQSEPESKQESWLLSLAKTIFGILLLLRLLVR